MEGSQHPEDINGISTFLAFEQVADLDVAEPVDCIVFCVSAILHCAEALIMALKKRPDLTKTLVICGGIGHSTPYLYQAVANHPVYSGIHEQIVGLPEARVMLKVFEKYSDIESIRQTGCLVFAEDKSTNCGANAIETRRLLEAHGVSTPRSFIIIQDPTMSRRTVASFEKAYSDIHPAPRFQSCPTFVPRMKHTNKGLAYAVPGVEASRLWEIPRFLDLFIGEIPRLRDDENGYGPNGKGFIVSVDIPNKVLAAWTRLSKTIERKR